MATKLYIPGWADPLAFIALSEPIGFHAGDVMLEDDQSFGAFSHREGTENGNILHLYDGLTIQRCSGDQLREPHKIAVTDDCAELREKTSYVICDRFNSVLVRIDVGKQFWDGRDDVGFESIEAEIFPDHDVNTCIEIIEAVHKAQQVSFDLIHRPGRNIEGKHPTYRKIQDAYSAFNNIHPEDLPLVARVDADERSAVVQRANMDSFLKGELFAVDVSLLDDVERWNLDRALGAVMTIATAQGTDWKQYASHIHVTGTHVSLPMVTLASNTPATYEELKPGELTHAIAPGLVATFDYIRDGVLARHPELVPAVALGSR